MRNFLLRRLVFVLLSVFGATIVVFSLAQAREDPVNLFIKADGYPISPEQIESIKAKWGLDKPLIVQYFVWLGNIGRLDLGRSLMSNRPVIDIMKERYAATIQLALAAWIFGTFTGIPLGVLSALKRGTAWDYFARAIALFGQSLPPFWIGMVGILIFAVMLGWLPAATKGTGQSLPMQLKHFVLPTLVLGWAPMAGYLRITRSAMLEVLDSEFVKLARAKGVGSNWVIWKHAFRNALIQPLTIAALLLAGYMDGATLVELTFAWPGVGRIAVDAANENDFMVLTGAVLMFTLMYVCMSFAADVMYAVVDPRIRYR